MSLQNDYQELEIILDREVRKNKILRERINTLEEENKKLEGVYTANGDLVYRFALAGIEEQKHVDRIVLLERLFGRLLEVQKVCDVIPNTLYSDILDAFDSTR